LPSSPGSGTDIRITLNPYGCGPRRTPKRPGGNRGRTRRCECGVRNAEQKPPRIQPRAGGKTPWTQPLAALAKACRAGPPENRNPKRQRGTPPGDVTTASATPKRNRRSIGPQRTSEEPEAGPCEGTVVERGRNKLATASCDPLADASGYDCLALRRSGVQPKLAPFHEVVSLFPASARSQAVPDAFRRCICRIVRRLMWGAILSRGHRRSGRLRHPLPLPSASVPGTL